MCGSEAAHRTIYACVTITQICDRACSCYLKITNHNMNLNYYTLLKSGTAQYTYEYYMSLSVESYLHPDVCSVEIFVMNNLNKIGNIDKSNHFMRQKSDGHSLFSILRVIEW